MKVKVLALLASLALLAGVVVTVSLAAPGAASQSNTDTPSAKPLSGAEAPQASPLASEEAISAAEAEEIALLDLGLSRDQVRFDRTEADYERGDLVWEVEVYHNGVEYDYHIKAADGSIRQKKTEGKPKTSASSPSAPATQAPAADEITEDEALALALSHAGLSADSIRGLRIQRDREDGAFVYEIEFFKDRLEYDYEIRCSDGKILSFDRDYED